MYTCEYFRLGFLIKNLDLRALGCVQFWRERFLCIILDSFVLQTTHSFSGRSMPGWFHSIKQVLQNMQQVEKVMLANYKQVDSLYQEPISKTRIFEMAFFDRNVYVLKSRNLNV